MNLGEILRTKIVNFWGPLTSVRGGNSKIWSVQKIFYFIAWQNAILRIYLHLALLSVTWFEIYPFFQKTRIFWFLRSSPHAPILELWPWNSKRKWASKISKGTKNFGRLAQKLGRYWGSKKIFPTPSLESQTYDFRNFLHESYKLNWLKTLKI